MQVRHAINAHKALVIPVVLGLMWYYDNYSVQAALYLSLHGTYSLLWLLKDRLYPDKQFEEKVPAMIGALFVFTPLCGYYAAPFLLISRKLAISPLLMSLSVSMVIFGVFLHYVSDAQKYYTLRLHKDLITDGLFLKTRNPNYLGEILIYSGFSLLSYHWIPFAILSFWICAFFLRNMLKKDKSLSRYPGFADYSRQSGLLIPRF